MQNIHLINSFVRPLDDFLQQPKDLPLISSLYGPDCKLFFPDLPSEPISAFFSDYLNHFLIFLEDEILEDGESEPYFTLPFLINFACLSSSGDKALLVSGSFPNDVYIFDVENKSLTKFEYNSETRNFEENAEKQYIDSHINDTDDSDDSSHHHKCDHHSCTCNSQKSNLQIEVPPQEEAVIHAAFRNDSVFAAIATKSYIHTISAEIPDQQGRYEQDIQNPCGVTWNPNGSWLAFSSSNRIIFTEKNCRLRQWYEIEEKDIEPIALSWSPHHDILAFLDNRNRLVILSMKNRVIYRKYVVNCLIPETSIVPQIYWSSNPDDLSLGIIDRTTNLVHVFEFNFSVDRNADSIFVVNGNTLLTSDWSRSLIPPPLSHRKISFGDPLNQITAITSNNEEIIVFTLNSIHLVNKDIQIPLQISSPVQCATFSKVNKDDIFFACDNVIFKFSLASSPYTVTEYYRFENEGAFVSFITPSFVVTSRTQISSLEAPDAQTGKTAGSATEFVQNNNEILSAGFGTGDTNQGDWVYFCSREGTLYLNGSKFASNVKSFLYDEKLLAYIFISTLEKDIKLGSRGWMCHIQYGLEKTHRQIEPLSQLLFFSRRIYSIISLMNRGNIETNAPHVIVEDALRNLIVDKEYSEGWRLSKKYQVPFSRFIQLGDIDLFTLCNQIADTQLRSCMSVLRPLDIDTERTKNLSNSSNQLKFVLSFLTFILGVEVTYEANNHKLIVPPYEHDRSEMATFPTTCCICFILLDDPVEAVRFSCSFSSSDLVKQCITFLLTLNDNNKLFDISLKTYDTKCIASVGLITMKEPSLYVPFIEELESIDNENLRMAKIDEAASDPESAVIHYALAGPEFDEKALYIIGRDQLFDAGLCSYPEGSETWLKVIQMKLDYLTGLDKKQRELKEDEIARTAIRSNNPSIILQYINEIVRSEMWQLALPCLSEDENGFVDIKNALEAAKFYKEAATFTAQYLPNAKDEAVRLFLQSHEWYKAIENGADKAEVALLAFDTLMKEANRKAEDAKNLKVRFDDVKEKQKKHKDSNIRHGKNKEKRGLPAIVSQLTNILPNEAKTNEFKQVREILKMIGENDKSEQLKIAFREMVREILPIPHLPDNEELPVPSFLQGIV